MRPPTYPSEAVDLPLDDWLYEAKPRSGCEQCANAVTELKAAKKAGNASARFEAARRVRQCAHGD